ncbi:hypothetical protein EYF80_029628 [Liparis tanakae]|uniref:Uncharacterized protein n=1 Tax=Liparis tanakae TaxID=230148 RepID=A0A4Z2H4I2_9TELE|nr:hypothetical protein EYF80_029628 [Liparis tanakae]
MKRGDKEERPERRSGVEECAWGPLTLASPGTGAFVGIDQVNAGAPVLARLGETLIDLVGAVGPHVSWHALREEEIKKKKKKKKPRRRRRKKRGRQREKRGDSLINVYPPKKSVQVAPFWQGLGVHSSTCSSQ